MLFKWLYLCLILSLFPTYINCRQDRRCLMNRNNGVGPVLRTRYYFDRNGKTCRQFTYRARRNEGNVMKGNMFGTFWQCRKACRN